MTFIISYPYLLLYFRPIKSVLTTKNYKMKIYQIRINGIATGFTTDALPEIISGIEELKNIGYENVDYLIITI